MKIAVLGGGASGMTSAICLARKGHDVTIIEKNKDLGKKLLITGNGRCNYYNSDFSYDKYFTDDIDSLKQIINEDNKNKVLSFFDYIGIVPKVINGYYYPFSNQAISFNECLKNTIINLNIKVLTEVNVNDLDKTDDKFVIKYNDNQEIIFDKVVLAMGSCCYPKTGSSGDGYNILKKFGHSVTGILPALTYLGTKDDLNKNASGVRCSSKVSLYINDKKVLEEKGELQINKDNISGICIFNISGLAIKELNNNKSVFVRINFLDELGIDENNVIDYLDDLYEKTNKKSVSSLLEGILNYKLVSVILNKAKIDLNKDYKDLNKFEIKSLSYNLFNYTISVDGYGDFDKSQTCQGGVPLNEINLKNMESKIVKGLYITGELLEPYGICGGYNLGFSFITGLVVGSDK